MRRFELLALFLLVLLGNVFGCQAPEGARSSAPAEPLAAEALLGVWTWDYGGVYGIGENAMRSQLKIEEISADGKLSGSEEFFLPDGTEYHWNLEDARASQEGGRWKVAIERLDQGATFTYSLTLSPDGRTFEGSFAKPGWQSDEVIFVKN